MNHANSKYKVFATSWHPCDHTIQHKNGQLLLHLDINDSLHCKQLLFLWVPCFLSHSVDQLVNMPEEWFKTSSERLKSFIWSILHFNNVIENFLHTFYHTKYQHGCTRQLVGSNIEFDRNLRMLGSILGHNTNFKSDCVANHSLTMY